VPTAPGLCHRRARRSLLDGTLARIGPSAVFAVLGSAVFAVRRIPSPTPLLTDAPPIRGCRSPPQSNTRLLSDPRRNLQLLRTATGAWSGCRRTDELETSGVDIPTVGAWLDAI
jgi:hypothetical protein